MTLVDELQPGDAFRLPRGSGALLVVGVCPADDLPAQEAEDGPVYETVVGHGVEPERLTDVDYFSGNHTVIHRPYHFSRLLAGGGEHVGAVDVDGNTKPFLCAGCFNLRRGHNRRTSGDFDGVACCYGCEVDAAMSERKEQFAD